MNVKPKRLRVFTVVGFVSLVFSVAFAQNSSRLVTAKTVAVVAQVEYLRVDKAKYDNQAEVNRILRIVEETDLLKTRVNPQARYRATDGDRADIIVTIKESVALPETVSIIVRDADTNEELFKEDREVVELRNDIKRLVKHFLASIDDQLAGIEAKKREAERAQEKERESKREALEAAQASRARQQCDEEEARFRQDIITVVIVQGKNVPAMNQDILDHNSRCPYNSVFPSEVIKRYKADEDTKKQAEKMQAERTRQVKERETVLASWQQEVASAPFSTPVSGQVSVSYQLPVITGSYYIIPSDGNPDNCTFSPQEKKKLKGAKEPLYLGVVQCSRSGRDQFVVMHAGDRFYLVHAAKAFKAEQVGTVRDKGKTICFSDGGCEHILAEVRLVPTELPYNIAIPSPGPLTATYNSDGLSFKYPSSWRVTNTYGGNYIQIAPPEGHVGSWAVLGVFITHSAPNKSFPPTLSGAFDLIIASSQKLGRVFNAQITPIVAAGRDGLTSTYTAPSPISGEENGRLTLIPDGEGGYYVFWSFSPGLETEANLAILENILATAELDTKAYTTDIYSGTIHNRTVDKTAPFVVKIRSDGEKLAGCVGIVKPLYGSGPFQGVTKNGVGTFSVKSNDFDIAFRAKKENSKILGTYSASPLGGVGGPTQDGDFTLEKTDTKALLFRPCPTDTEMNSMSR